MCVKQNFLGTTKFGEQKIGSNALECYPVATGLCIMIRFLAHSPETTEDVCNEFSWEVQWRHFAHPFQIADNANGSSQNASPFLHLKENSICYSNSHKKFVGVAMLPFHSGFFSHSIKLRGLPLSAVTVSLHYLPTCQRSAITCVEVPATVTWSEYLKIWCRILRREENKK